MQVYQIIFEVDDFQSLLASDPEVHKTRLMAMDGDSRIDLWPKNLETELDNKRGLIPDIYSVNTGNMLLNDKALKLLEEYITEREELLPVSWGSKHGTLINPVGTFECLDHDKTIWNMDESNEEKLWIEEYAFDLDKVPDVLLFRVEGDWFSLFCVDFENGRKNFKSIVESSNLQGLSFLRV